MTNLDRWRIYCQDLESSNEYIDWTFYAVISSALQRRVCLDQIPHIAIGRPLFPNLYIIFIGPPGIGKSSSASVAVELFKAFGGFASLEEHSKRLIKVAPSSLTFEQLLRYMNNNYTIYKLPDQYQSATAASAKKLTHYLSTPLAFFAVEELGSLFRESSPDVVKFVCEGYDCGDYHRETKTQGTDFIKNMCVMLFGCATPDWIEEVSKNGLLRQGFTARTIFLWSDSRRHLRTFWRFDRPEQQTAWKELQEHVKKLTQLYGPVHFSNEAREWIINWYEKGGETKALNKAKCLVDYYNRKKVHLLKMSMVQHFAEHCSTTIELPTVEKALAFLESVEPTMHKALLGSQSENPAHRVALMIEDLLVNGSRVAGTEFMSDTKFVREGKLLLHVYEHCLNGRATFDDAVKYLLDTGRIVQGMEQGKIAYRALKITSS